MRKNKGLLRKKCEECEAVRGPKNRRTGAKVLRSNAFKSKCKECDDFEINPKQKSSEQVF